MNQPNRTSRRLPLLAALTLAAALGACSRQTDEDLTAGQRVDNAIAGAKDSARDAQMSASDAATTTAQVSTDMGITAKVNAALVADDQLKATQINVDTRDGQVTLSGNAPDAQSRERATTLAAAVDGVKNVNNQLVVNG